MIIFKRSNRTLTGAGLPAAFLLAALFASSAQAALPENSFACQVETRENGHGLVRVQAHTMQAARRIALESDALTRDGKRAQATALVQCVEVPKGKFSDLQFQYFYENVER